MVNGSHVRELRHLKGIAQRDVSMATGITERTLYDLETGVSTNPTIKTLQAIADFYGVPVDDLVAGEN